MPKVNGVLLTSMPCYIFFPLSEVSVLLSSFTVSNHVSSSSYAIVPFMYEVSALVHLLDTVCVWSSSPVDVSTPVERERASERERERERESEREREKEREREFVCVFVWVHARVCVQLHGGGNAGVEIDYFLQQLISNTLATH
jgi:hypothetical protein